MTPTQIYSTPFSIPIAPISNIYNSISTLSNSSYTFSNYNYAIKLFQVDYTTGNLPSNNKNFITELFIPPRPSYGRGLFSPAQYLQSYFYNPDYYVYNCYATGALENGPFSSYQFAYGSSWNPELQIAAIQKVGTGIVFNIGFTFSKPHGLTAGDIIFVSAEDTTISGEQKIIPFGLTDTRFLIDKIWATPSVSTGYITAAKRYDGTSSIYGVWNGTSQWTTRATSYEYLLAGHLDAAPNSQIQKFISTYGTYDYWNTTITFGDIIEKKASAYESIGFIADPVELFDNTGGDLILNWKTYTATGSVVGTFSYNIGVDGNYYITRYEVGVGINNLPPYGLLINGNEKYWDLYFTDSSDDSIISEIRRYIIDDECSAYTPIIVSWINRLGSLDYFTFTQNSRVNLNINRNEWKKELNLDPFYQTIDRGRGVISQSIKKSINLNSNWISEQEYAWLNELITSQYVWILQKNEEGDTIPFPVIVTDSSYEFKKKLTEQIFNLSITLDFANDVWSVNQNQ